MKDFLDAIINESDVLADRIADLRVQLNILTKSIDPNADNLEPELERKCLDLQVKSLESYAKTLADIEHLVINILLHFLP